MGPVDVAIVVVVVAVVAFGAWRALGTARGTRDCCSGDAKQPEASARKTFSSKRPAGADPADYPYETVLEVGGMTCEHCVANVTAALESVEGTYAEVSLAGGVAHVRTKAPADTAALTQVVEEAGYRVLSAR